ncbi:c-type cytochrome [Undibacterium amnicola]|uniref:C-type cytochrome n=2 Tax=Undibacterium amnicola TaxID=1834038 RepID=A0ABR6XV73_9BURK|nr:c-type cytochrome [Undibacterium amnicola]
MQLSCLMMLLGLSLPGWSQEPMLEVSDGVQVKQWTRAALLAESVEIQIRQDSAYKRPMSYRAVPYAKLMPKMAADSSVQFVASDGFVANISAADLSGKGQPYLAIETAEQGWPAVNPNNPLKTASAGPFYLVWLTPEAGKISNEQWPYQVVKIRVELPLQQRFPQLVPSPKLQASYQQAMLGMSIYIKNCAVCHRLNDGGDAAIGPDLNLPWNPTEYFQAPYLHKLIRQPSSVRSWKQALMPGFDVQTLSDQDLDHLLVYLKHMAATRSLK